jgi:hypothetical protein
MDYGAEKRSSNGGTANSLGSCLIRRERVCRTKPTGYPEYSVLISR